ncbi:response regulator receiver [Ectothiorhodospira sp. PHS-1]|uniref:response regulator n=1 Tax=Ectothiorhodospira sp. PHS-1 TaxID=519989 RepID=UPI00024A84E8|nr:response regulator [Ectothiorhodospira sp. PHS-1]EHQ52254.1 response regulator receiver [Ectothiorhodospira sp. PHS-1]
MGSSAHAVTILVVDDSRVMRKALNKILSPRYQVLEAEDGEAAWRLLRSESAIAGIFTDLSMPELDGYGLLKRVRDCEDARIRKLPVVVVTGNEDDVGTAQRVREHGADEMLKKPFRGEAVLKLTERLLGAPSPAVAPAPAGELQSLRDQLSQALSQAAAALKARDQMEKELKQVRTELMLRQQTSDEREMQVRLKQQEQALATARAGEQRLTAALEQHQARNNELEARIQGLNRDLEQAATELAQARGRGDGPDRQARNQEARIKAEELARLQAEDELLSVSRRLEELEQALAAAHQEVHEARADAGRLRGAHREREQQLEERCRQLETRLAQVMAQVAEAAPRAPAEASPSAGAEQPAPAPFAGMGETSRSDRKGAESVARWEEERSRARRRRLWLIVSAGGLAALGLAFWLGTLLG